MTESILSSEQSPERLGSQRSHNAMAQARKQKEKIRKHSQHKRKPLKVNDRQGTLAIDDVINNHETIEEKDSSSLSRFGARVNQDRSHLGARRSVQYEETWNTIDRAAEHENLLDSDLG